MQLGLVSDVHLEFGGYNDPFGTGHVLLVAGDLHVAAYLASDRPELDEIKERSRSFFNRAREHYDHVVCVAGNHEHYQGIYDYTNAILCREFQNDRVHILERESIQVDDYIFYGATMWTDMNQNDLLTKKRLVTGMNDFAGAIQINDLGDIMERRLFTPDDAREIHLESLRGLQEVIDHPERNDRKIVVATHHCPHPNSTPPRYKHQTTMNGGYVSDLSAYMGDHVPLWVHGHTHDSCDYNVGPTRVVCNPRGYVGHALNRNFNPTLTLELP